MLYSLCVWVGLCGLPSQISGPAYAIDGDTIIVLDSARHFTTLRVRLHGIDAEELSEPHGYQAKVSLQQIIQGGVGCKLTGEVSYNRHIGTCYNQDGLDVGAEMVRLGFALDCAHYSGGQYKPLEPSGIHSKLIQKPYC